MVRESLLVDWQERTSIEEKDTEPALSLSPAYPRSIGDSLSYLIRSPSSYTSVSASRSPGDGRCAALPRAERHPALLALREVDPLLAADGAAGLDVDPARSFEGGQEGIDLERSWSTKDFVLRALFAGRVDRARLGAAAVRLSSRTFPFGDRDGEEGTSALPLLQP